MAREGEGSEETECMGIKRLEKIQDVSEGINRECVFLKP